MWFNYGTASNSYSIKWLDDGDNELERMCKKAATVLSQNLLDRLWETMETSVRIVVTTEIQTRCSLVQVRRVRTQISKIQRCINKYKQQNENGKLLMDCHNILVGWETILNVTARLDHKCAENTICWSLISYFFSHTSTQF